MTGRRSPARSALPARVVGRCVAAALVASIATIAPPLVAPASAQTAASTDPALATLLADARRALADGRSADAYRLLDAQAARHVGDVGFDYLLGLAALDTGRAGIAVLALERVLAAEPGHLQARAEIGRAYLQLRELDAARRELETVSRAELPPAVRDTVRRYLDVVARLGDVRRPSWIVLLEAGLGFDTNVNFGSSFGEWVLADGQALTPLASSRPRESAFATASAGVTYVAPINGWIDWTAGLNLSQRTNPSQHNIDTDSAELSAGLSTSSGPHRYSMSVQYQHLRLDGASFRDAAGAIVQWQWASAPRTQLGAYLQAFDLSFPGEPIRDARRAGIGATVAHGFAVRFGPTVAAALYGGAERPREDVPQLAFSFAGLRTAFGATLAPGWRANAGVSYERRGYDGVEPLFGVARTDDQIDLRIGMERDIGRSLTIAPTIAWTRNASTLAPNDFRRTQAFVTARYRF